MNYKQVQNQVFNKSDSLKHKWQLKHRHYLAKARKQGIIKPFLNRVCQLFCGKLPLQLEKINLKNKLHIIHEQIGRN